MAKTKISELEKSIGADRKDIIAYLNEKGVDVKTAGSSVDDDAVAMVTTHFSKPAAKAAPKKKTEPEAEKKPEETAAKTATKKPAGEPSAEKKTDAPEKKVVKTIVKTVVHTAASGAAPAAKPAAPAQNGQAAPHKKRIIIITGGGNAHPGQNTRPAGAAAAQSSRPAAAPARPAQEKRSGFGGERRGGTVFSTQPVHHIIKPKTVPSQMEVDFHKTEAPKAEPVAEVRNAKQPAADTAATPVDHMTVPGNETAAQAAPQNTAAAEHKEAGNTVKNVKPENAEMSGMAGTAAESAPAAEHAAAETKAAEPKTADFRAAEAKAPENRAPENKAPETKTPGTAGGRSSSAPTMHRDGGSGASQGRRIYTNTQPSAGTGYNRQGGSGSQGGYGQNRSYQGSGQGGYNRQGGSGSQGSYNRQGGSGSQGGYGQNRSYQGSGQGGYNRQGGSGSQGSYGQNRSYQGSGQGGYNRQGGSGTQGSYGQNRSYQGSGQGGYNRPAGGYGQSRPGGGYQGGGYNRQGSGQGGYGQNRPGGGYGQGRPGMGAGNRRPGVGGRGPAAGGDTFVRDAEKHRDGDKRKIGQEKDKRSRKDYLYTEEDQQGKKRAGRFIRPEISEQLQPEELIKTISIPEKITVHDLAEKMHKQPAELIKKQFLEKNQILTPNSELTYKEAEDIAVAYEILCEEEEKIDVIQELLKEDEDAPETLVPRPPVICVMGHVDHGKTSLLDKIRKTHVTDREAGGITQAIGAYTVGIKGRMITFLDTPGHEAFTAMRMRGANSTDIAILVVAADDGVMPQTIEAINHAKAAGIEIIVAVNKIDKPNANIDLVKQELTKYELVATDWGGNTEFVPVSAKTGQGIDDLLETILLTADILELKANPNRKARGLVLEAKLDKGRGPVANVLVQKGTLHVGDFISAGASYGKVRALVDDKNAMVKEAGPSVPVEILGLSDVPMAGEVLVAHEDEKTARSYAETYKNQHKEDLLEETKMRMSLDDLFSQMKEGKLKEFDVIIKADVQGSAEALKQSLVKLSNDEIVVKCIHSGVGAISESDVTLASASNAVIIGFNVRSDPAAKAMADREGVDVRLYKVIYEAIDAVDAALKGMEAPIYEEQIIGHAEVRQLFHASKVGNIAGSSVTDGVIRRGCKVRITRDGDQIYEGTLTSLKRFKDDAKEVKEGYECGLVFDGYDAIQAGDLVEAYDMAEVPKERREAVKNAKKAAEEKEKAKAANKAAAADADAK
jgi:translation initiation factor IF-2